VVMEPDSEWAGGGSIRKQIAEWTKQRGASPRLYPGSLIWCLKKPGRDLREEIELWLAWQRVSREISEGTLGTEFDRGGKGTPLNNSVVMKSDCGIGKGLWENGDVFPFCSFDEKR